MKMKKNQRIKLNIKEDHLGFKTEAKSVSMDFS